MLYFFFFFKQKTAYEMRISDWSSDVCSSDLLTLDNASVDEGSEGAVVGTLTVVDPDNSESFTYAVSDDRFEVVGGQLRLRDGEALDYEAEPAVPLTVTVTDSAGNTFTQDFEIAVNDQADAPAVDLNGPEPGSDSRSEEHTSEL